MIDANQEIKDIFKLEAQASRIHAKVNKKVEQLRKHIKKGKTTGDKIKDFVIVHYGFSNEKIEAIYRDIETHMQQHVGEFVLLVAKEENFHGCIGYGYKPKDEDYVLEEHLYLGVLRDGTLILDPADERCELPVGSYVLHQDAWHENVELVEGNLVLHWLRDLGLDLNKPLERKNPYACLRKEPALKLEVIIGDTEAKAWFEKQSCKNPYLVIFKKAAQLLGRQLP